ncbi:MAG TPA: glycosyltransferase family 2 protein, partial [Oligoflexia bacterium]|nr:glycosyltransferase family 2 protein [Oligoflexia bacterium]
MSNKEVTVPVSTHSNALKPGDAAASPQRQNSLVPTTSALRRRSRFSWIQKNSFYYKDLEKLFSFHVPKNGKVVEIGHGVGRLLSGCVPAQGLGIELDLSTVEEARSHTEYPVEYWDGTSELPSTVLHQMSEGVDTILLVNTVGYWSDIEVALKKMAPLCRPHTRIIAVYYNFLWAFPFRIAQKLRLKMPQADQNWLSAADVANLFRLSNYRVVKQGYRCLMPVNLGPISWFMNRVLGNLPGLSRLGCTHFVIARPEHKIEPKNVFASVIIPARNEQGNIESAVRRMAQIASERKEKYEIVFVEGNSTDDTWGEIQRVINDPSIPKPFPVRAFKQPGKGKGDACRKGYAHADGNLFLILDADLTVPPEDLPKFVDAYCDGHGEFINGCRLVYKMEREAMRPLNLLGNKFFSYAFTWLLGQRFKDTLCGTKVLSRDNYRRLEEGRAYFGDFDPFGDFDLIFGASKLN